MGQLKAQTYPFRDVTHKNLKSKTSQFL